MCIRAAGLGQHGQRGLVRRRAVQRHRRGHLVARVARARAGVRAAARLAARAAARRRARERAAALQGKPQVEHAACCTDILLRIDW